MSGPPFGDEITVMDIEAWGQTQTDKVASLIVRLGEAIDRRDAAIADLCVSLAAKKARHAEAAASVARVEAVLRQGFAAEYGLMAADLIRRALSGEGWTVVPYAEIEVS